LGSEKKKTKEETRLHPLKASFFILLLPSTPSHPTSPPPSQMTACAEGTINISLEKKLDKKLGNSK
jgi:hypothetical protein